MLGGRPAAWTALEDKLVADEIWDAVGGPGRPSRIVSRSTRTRCAGVDRALDTGDGVVWAGDARDGFNGGGDFVRWVVDRRTTRAAALRVLRRRAATGSG